MQKASATMTMDNITVLPKRRGALAMHCFLMEVHPNMRMIFTPCVFHCSASSSSHTLCRMQRKKFIWNTCGFHTKPSCTMRMNMKKRRDPLVFTCLVCCVWRRCRQASLRRGILASRTWSARRSSVFCSNASRASSRNAHRPL